MRSNIPKYRIKLIPVSCCIICIIMPELRYVSKLFWIMGALGGKHTDSGATRVGSSLEERPFEAIAPPSKVARLWDHLLLIFVVGDNLGQFVLDVV